MTVIQNKNKISFKYLRYNINDVNKQAERRQGQKYVVSPFKLIINDANYYMLAFSDKDQEMRTYRVDRMKDVTELKNEPVDGEREFLKAAAPEWEKTNLVFTNSKGGVLSYRTVYDCFKRIVKKMGCPELRFHDLRHQYAVIAIKNGDDIKTIQGNLGHATAAFTLDVYGHVTEQMKRDSANRMESFIDSVMKS